MATKKFNQMSTKKLTALMATASDEDKATIQEILDARAQAQAKQDPNEHEAPENTSALTPEEEAAIAAAEANGGINPMYAGNGGSKAKKPKMTEEELDAIVEQLQDKVLCKCQVLSMNTLEWQDGYIAGVVKDAKAGKVLYAIQLFNSNRKIAKVTSSNLVKVLDEKIDEEEIKKHKAAKAKKATSERTVDFANDEELAQKFEEASLNRGKLVKFKAFGHSEDTIEGRITGLMVDRRVSRIMYTISVVTGQDENGKDIVKKYNKMISSTDLVIAEDFDEEGQKMQDNYQARKNGEKVGSTTVAKTPEERILFYGERLEKANKEMEALKAKIQKYQEAYDKANAELVAATKDNADVAEATSSEEAEELA